jgi:spore coat protein U-like protein
MNLYSKRAFPKAAAIAAIVLAASLPIGAAHADATSDLVVTANVAATCTIDASAGLDFGAYDPVVANASADKTGTGSISTTCTNGYNATITLDQGQHADTGSSDIAPLRRMTDGTDFLSYNLYSDAGNTNVWGADATTSFAVAQTGAAVVTPVYGVIPAGQNVGVASYTDTVVATVEF